MDDQHDETVDDYSPRHRAHPADRLGPVPVRFVEEPPAPRSARTHVANEETR